MNQKKLNLIIVKIIFHDNLKIRISRNIEKIGSGKKENRHFPRSLPFPRKKTVATGEACKELRTSGARRAYVRTD